MYTLLWQVMYIQSGSLTFMHFYVSYRMSSHSFVEPMCCCQFFTHNNPESTHAALTEMSYQTLIQRLGVPLTTLIRVHGNAQQLSMRQIGQRHSFLA